MLGSGIYKIENQVNGRFYIGSAINIQKRWRYHIQDLHKGKHGNNYLQKAWDKYGTENFIFEVLEHCEPLDLIRKEQHYLDNTSACENGYNICPIAGSKLGTKMPPEAIRKSSEARMGWKHTEEARRKISIASKSRRYSEETKKRQSEAKMGEKNPMYGKHYMGEDAPNYGHYATQETKEKMSRTRTGMKIGPFSDKARENMRNGAKNRKSSKGFKIGPMSEERKAKLSITTTNYWRRKKNAQEYSTL